MIEREVFNLSLFFFLHICPVLLWSTERIVVLGGSLKGEMAFLSLTFQNVRTIKANIYLYFVS